MRGACRIFVAAMLGLICSACSVTRKIPEGQYLLQKVKIDADKAKQWIANGAQPTDTVKDILKKSGVID